MPAITWKSPLNGLQQIHGPKNLAVQFNSSSGLSPARYLDLAVGALAEIDGGQLWEHSGRFAPFPEAGPGAVQLTSSGAYSSEDREGRVTLHMVAQPHMHDPSAVGLILSYQDAPTTPFALHWMEQISEVIVAITTMCVGDSVRRALGWAHTENPTESWSWLTGAWLSTREVQYGDWTVRLQR